MLKAPDRARADQLLYRGPHGVVAAVDMDEFARGSRPPVREQAHHGPSDGIGVGGVPAEGRLTGPLAFDLLEAADAFRGQGLDRARRDQVDPDTALSQVASEITRCALQGGLGHAHPVVGWPGDTGVEVQADDRGSWSQELDEADGERLQGVGRGLEGRGDGGPLCGEEVTPQGVLRGEGDGVDDPVEFPPAFCEVVGDRFDVLWLVYIKFEDGGFGVETSGRSLRETSGAAEAAKNDLRPLLLGQPGCRVGYGAPVQDTGNQNLLAFEQSAHCAS